MTDKETSLAFVERMERTGPERRMDIPNLIYLAKTAALIEEYKLEPRWNDEREAWFVSPSYRIDPCAWNKDLYTAALAVADKIKEQA